MITNQNRQEIVRLAERFAEMVPEVKLPGMMADGYGTVFAGVMSDENTTDAIWIRNGSDGSFLFVSPCLRHGRAETFITSDGILEFTLHLVDRYWERVGGAQPRTAENGGSGCKIEVCEDMSEREAMLVRKVAWFFCNEKVLGQVAVTKERGAVLRTTNGLILCSEKELHKGVMLANTFVSDQELMGSQKEAVRLWDEGKTEEARMVYEGYWV